MLRPLPSIGMELERFLRPAKCGTGVGTAPNEARTFGDFRTTAWPEPNRLQILTETQARHQGSGLSYVQLWHFMWSCTTSGRLCASHASRLGVD